MARATLMFVEDFRQMDVADQVRVWDDLPAIWQQEIVCHGPTPFEVLWHAVKVAPWYSERVGFVRDEVPSDMLWDTILHQALEGHIIPWFIAGHPALSEDMLLVLCDLCTAYCGERILGHKNASPAIASRFANYPDDDGVRRRARKALKAGAALRSVFQKMGPRVRTWNDED